MTFRAKLLLAFVPLVLIPLAVLAVGVRAVLNDRFRDQFGEQMAATVAAIDADLTILGSDLARRLSVIGNAAAGDNRFRLGVAGGGGERQYVLDYAVNAMALSGLAVLQIQDERGRVVSSGHFRNQFDEELPVAGRLPEPATNRLLVMPITTAAESFPAIVSADSFRLGTRWLHITAGVELADRVSAWAGSAEGITVRAVTPESANDTSWADASAFLFDELTIPYFTGGASADRNVRVLVAHSLEPLRALQRQVDTWSLIVFGVAGGVTLAVAIWIAARISRPIAELAERTSSLDLDKLDVRFSSSRRDEVGTLSRLLASMVERLRTSTVRLREAERRAAVGDLARQVNHDIKNGLVPIRNVIQHLSEVQRDDPANLSRVFAERRDTIDSSIAYLEKLATHYARLTPDRRTDSCDLGDVLDEVVRGLDVPAHCHLEVRHGDAVPAVRADRLALRRIMENLVGNAIDSLEGRAGSVVLASERSPTGAAGPVLLTVRDTGRGMRQDELDRAFRDFHTTKPGGTGLGLSVVRRLIGDMGGGLRVETAPDRGTTVYVELPALGESGNDR